MQPSYRYPVEAVREALKTLAAQHVHIGTSSWKYPGWVGLLYDEQRYLYRGKFAASRFEKTCLEEFSDTFRSVCVDAGYYKFPSPEYINNMCKQVPQDFRFSFKVTDEITTRTFPKLPRHGDKGGTRNPNFLNAELFRLGFLNSVAPHRDRIGILMFEFSHFHSRDFERGREFMEMLDEFLSQLPKGWQYGVEVRNKNLLHPDYFAMLRSHGVAHVFNHWTHMPPVGEQYEMPDSLTAGDFMAARFLLRQGRTFEQAVDSFSPYNSTKEVNEEARKAALQIIKARLYAASSEPAVQPSYLFFNNRLEGCSLFTILAILAQLGLISGDLLPDFQKPKKTDEDSE